jgi:glycosyltransferase involved in cell wall biosynthesis
MHIGLLTPEYVTPENVNGGLANYLKKVAAALARRGHRISILLLSDHRAQWQDGAVTVHEIERVAAPERAHEIRVLGAVVPAGEEVLSSRRLAAAVWRIHRTEPFDLLQASSFRSPGYALRRNGRVPLVCRVSSYTPMVRSADGRRCRPSEYLTDWLELRQVLDADAAFAPSRLMADAFARNAGFEPEVLRTPADLSLTSGLDSSYYDAHLAGMPYLLFFGSLCRLKGTDLVAEIIPAIAQKHPRLQLVFVGRDNCMPDGSRVLDLLRSRAGEHAARVRYQPALAKPQLGPVIANALGALMPSRVDNYPNTCLEAQAFGVPVVGSRDSSLEEMISDGETGFLVQNGSAASLLEGIERLLRLTPDERLAMKAGILARAEAEQAEDRVGQLIAFYEGVIARFRAQGTRDSAAASSPQVRADGNA